MPVFVKSRRFSPIPPGTTCQNFRTTLGSRKLDPELSCGVVCVILQSAILIQYRLVTTDGHTTTAYTALHHTN